MSGDVALLVIDVQNGLVEETNPASLDQGELLLKRVSSLIDRARQAKVPVVFVQHNDPAIPAGTPGWQIHPAIAPQEGEAIVHKTTPDSFYQTDLEQVLKERGIKRLVVCGLQTEYCLDTTVRRAFAMGYDVTLVLDAHSTYDNGRLTATQIIAHHNSILAEMFAHGQTAEEVSFASTGSVAS